MYITVSVGSTNALNFSLNISSIVQQSLLPSASCKPFSADSGSLSVALALALPPAAAAASAAVAADVVVAAAVAATMAAAVTVVAVLVVVLVRLASTVYAPTKGPTR